MPQRLVECVPNFSEGRDRAKIEQIADAVRAVAGVQLLDVDPGVDANRTVMTFVGPPETVAEAAFCGIAKAAEVIDMRVQHGSHPRIGATDVCPFVPVEGVTMEECVQIARQVGRRVADELGIPVYLYEAAAASPQRRDLAAIRKGEYEGLAEKLRDPAWAPDFGKPVFNPRSGATVIGARDFLIAYNITLNTRDRSAAADIALELRERAAPPGQRPRRPIISTASRFFFRRTASLAAIASLPARRSRRPKRIAALRTDTSCGNWSRSCLAVPLLPTRNSPARKCRARQVQVLQGDRLVRGGLQAGTDFHQSDELPRHAAAPGPGGSPQAGGGARAGRNGQRGRGFDPVRGAIGRRAILPSAAGPVGTRADGRHPGNGRLFDGSERRAAV